MKRKNKMRTLHQIFRTIRQSLKSVRETYINFKKMFTLGQPALTPVPVRYTWTPRDPRTLPRNVRRQS